jgi:hypothetical protein
MKDDDEKLHPLEEIFNLPASETQYDSSPKDLVVHDAYDEKDSEVEEQFAEVYELALEAFRSQQEAAEYSDPKYGARNMEVAEKFLATALNAAKEKSTLKQHKDKLDVSKQAGPSHVSNNLIVADRNELLKKLLGDDDGSKES